MISALLQKSNLEFQTFFKKIQILWFPCCSTCEDLPIDASITNVGLILTKLWWFLFSGWGQTDRHGYGILIWKHVGTQKISTQSSKLVVSRRSLAICLPGGRGCIIAGVGVGFSKMLESVFKKWGVGVKFLNLNNLAMGWSWNPKKILRLHNPA